MRGPRPKSASVSSRATGFWARRRHLGLCGIPFGVVADRLVLGGLIVALIVPGKRRPSACSRRRVEVHCKQHERYPAPDERSPLSQGAFEDGRGANDEIINDGFGRPLLYRASGRGWLASQSIRSLGFDGEPGRDDLCISGQTRLMCWADKAGGVARFVGFRRGRFGEAVRSRLADIQALRREP